MTKLKVKSTSCQGFGKIPEFPMKLIVGLGNPGKEYEKTRHNVGFMVVDAFAKELGFTNWKDEKYARGASCRGFVESCCEDVVLLKPDTYMNKSGEAVKKALHDLHLTEQDLLVVHDDLDLELGTLKLAYGSGSAGHNGVQSVIDTFGTKDFWRLRIGVGPKKGEADEFVLKRFPKLQQGKVKKAITEAVAAIHLLFQKGPHAAQTEINKVK